MSDIFCIFTSGETCNETYQRPDPGGDTTLVIIATDGSCFNNGGEDAQAGAGGYIGPDNTINFVL